MSFLAAPGMYYPAMIAGGDATQASIGAPLVGALLLQPNIKVNNEGTHKGCPYGCFMLLSLMPVRDSRFLASLGMTTETWLLLPGFPFS